MFSDLSFQIKSLAVFRRLRENSVFSDGEYIPLKAELGDMVFIRKKGEKEVLIAVNRWCEPSTVEIPDRFARAKVLHGNSPCGTSLTISGEDFTVLSL